MYKQTLALEVLHVTREKLSEHKEAERGRDEEIETIAQLILFISFPFTHSFFAPFFHLPNHQKVLLYILRATTSKLAFKIAFSMR